MGAQCGERRRLIVNTILLPSVRRMESNGVQSMACLAYNAEVVRQTGWSIDWSKLGDFCRKAVVLV